VLDSGPLGLLTQRRGHSDGDRCFQWARDRIASGAHVWIPEIADY
jgi:hypothetical protein